MGIEGQFENRNMLDIISYNSKIKTALNKASNDLAMRIAIIEMKSPTKIVNGSFYKINKSLEKRINIILNNLHKDIQSNIQNGIVTHWDMANLKNDKLVGIWAEDITLGKGNIPASFNQLNMVALDSFLVRTTAGMNLSSRVWNLVNGAKDQLELYLSSGIAVGKSAAGIARDVKQYLNEPNKLFRRVRKEGKLVLSKSARGYHPGSGIYRSSYRNALRLTRTEINMAYRMSDYTRRQQLPFVIGIEVHLSASHPRLDMCFISGMYKVLTSKGWVSICKIKENDLVLSHEGKFRRVTKKYKTTTHKVEMRTIEYKCGYDNRAKSKKISSTENHPFLVNDKWTPAKDIKVGDKVKILASRCEWCGKKIPYYREYCSKSCASNATTKKQWSNPKHREGVSKKEIDRVINNHSDNFEFVDVIIEKVKSWTAENKAPITRYNLEVKKDNSYIIKGFVVHNCDDLVGKYPKGFIFIGWHPSCLCYTTSIMLNKKDSLKFMKTGKIAKSKHILRIPKKATKWIKTNAKAITGYKNTPYFIKDNFTKDFKLKDHVLRTTIPTPAPTPAGTDMQLLRISEFNKKYADAKIEHCIAVDKKGNILISKSGSKNHINFSQAEFDRMNVDNMIFTHNHPSGSSFSGDDINMLGAYKRGTEVRAIGTNYEYSVKIIDNTKFPNSGTELKDFFRIENTALQKKYQVIYESRRDYLIKSGFKYDEAVKYATKVTSQRHTHEAMEMFAKKFGIEYKRWVNK